MPQRNVTQYQIIRQLAKGNKRATQNGKEGDSISTKSESESSFINEWIIGDFGAFFDFLGTTSAPNRYAYKQEPLHCHCYIMYPFVYTLEVKNMSKIKRVRGIEINAHFAEKIRTDDKQLSLSKCPRNIIIVRKLL